jgi:sugar (glycoside-pentoside-hexuronide) transporter
MNNETILTNTVTHDKTGKLSFGTKFSYGIGDLASNLSWGLVSTYLLFFYTDVFGISAAVAGVIILTARIWDCFVDPIVGLVVERTNTRFGRFRPYVLFGSVVLAIFNTLTFMTPSLSPTGKIIYATVTYFILGTVYSIVNVPYGALGTVMTRDTNERTTLNSFRGFFSLISNVITGAALMPLVMALGQGNNQKGFGLGALVISLFTLPLFYMVFRNCKEVIQPPKENHPSIKDSIRAISLNKPFILIAIFLFLLFTALFGRLGTVIFYYIYVMGRPDLIAPLMAGFGLCTAVGSIVVGVIAKHFEKRTLAITGVALCGAVCIAIYLIPATSITAIMILSTIGFIPVGFGAPMVFSMVADSIDYSEWKHGSRADGAIYSVTSLITKISSALIGGITAIALGLIGYVPNAMQSAETVQGLNMVVNLIPGVIYLIAIIPMCFYGITKAKAQNYAKEIEERRANL